MEIDRLFSFFHGAEGSWSSFEQHQLTRLKNGFGQDLHHQVWEQGVTDRGEPWIVAVEAESQSLVLHLARIDGAYVVLGDDLSPISVGKNLKAVITECLGQFDTMRRDPYMTEGVCLRLPSGVSLAALSSVLIDHAKRSLWPNAADGAEGTAAGESDLFDGQRPELSGPLFKDMALSNLAPKHHMPKDEAFTNRDITGAPAEDGPKWADPGPSVPAEPKGAGHDGALPVPIGQNPPNALLSPDLTEPRDAPEAIELPSPAAAGPDSGTDQPAAASNPVSDSPPAAEPSPPSEPSGPPVAISDGDSTGTSNLAEIDAGMRHILGTARNDWLVGTAQDELIVGGSGSDQLSGGAGADIFVFSADALDGTSDRNVITDFDSSQDGLLLSNGVMISAIRHVDGDLFIRLEGDGDLIVLLNADYSALSRIEFADDFVLI